MSGLICVIYLIVSDDKPHALGSNLCFVELTLRGQSLIKIFNILMACLHFNIILMIHFKYLC